MINNITSEEIIEVGGVEYTLFLNRQGITTWEKKTKFQEIVENFKDGVDELTEDKEIEITDETNPFEIYPDIDIDSKLQELKESYIVLYWIALYTNHKLNITQTRDWFEKAEEEYGLEQLIEFGSQLISDVNKNKSEIKNLKALRPTK